MAALKKTLLDKELLKRIEELEKKNKQNRILHILLGIGFFCFLIYGFKGNTSFDILRTKGIIIEDENGKDRILIGAPIPYSKDRVRTDTAKVKANWASSFGSEAKNYMNYYKDYNHSTDGIVIMNDEGFDRVLVGDKLADPNTGQKMFESAGITWNDKKGWELGGAGVNTSADGSARAVMGLDDPKTNGEAIHMVALEDGTKALIIGSELGRLVIGMNAEKSEFIQTNSAFTGIKYFNQDGVLEWEQSMMKK